MEMLRDTCYRKALAFLDVHGRPIDRALLDLDLGTGSEEEVCAALAPYQNSDGGFGNALEPDVRIEGSSVYLTTVALRTLRRFRKTAGAEMWGRALDYLMATYDGGRATWELAPPEVDTVPGPSWWEYKMGPTYFGEFLLNPRAEIVGYLYESDDRRHHTLANGLIYPVLDVMDERLEKMGLYDVFCCARLAETECVPEPNRTRARRTFTEGMKGWLASETYRPLEFVERVNSFLARAFPGEVEEDLDALIGKQAEDGAWVPWWDWGEDLAAEWRPVLVEWKSEHTSFNLRLLHGYGRIETP